MGRLDEARAAAAELVQLRQEVAILQPQVSFEVGRRLPHAQYLATADATAAACRVAAVSEYQQGVSLPPVLGSHACHAILGTGLPSTCAPHCSLSSRSPTANASQCLRVLRQFFFAFGVMFLSQAEMSSACMARTRWSP